jgi:hypothetical protein
VNLRGRIDYLLARLRTHKPDCENCTAGEVCGGNLLKRLEELNWRTLPRSLDTSGEVAEVAETIGEKGGLGAEVSRVTPRQV